MKKNSALPLAFDEREILFCSFFCTFYFHLKPFPVCFSLTFCKGFAVYGMVFIHPFIHFLNVLIIINFTAFLTTSRAAVWMMRLAEPSCYRMAPAVAILLKNIKIFQIPSFWAHICIKFVFERLSKTRWKYFFLCGQSVVDRLFFDHLRSIFLFFQYSFFTTFRWHHSPLWSQLFEALLSSLWFLSFTRRSYALPTL